MSYTFKDDEGLKGRFVNIFQGDLDIFANYPNSQLLITEEVTLKVNNTYTPLLGEINGSNLLNLLSIGTEKSTIFIPSQHQAQTMSIWKQTDPLKFDFTVELKMLNSGRNDVLKPVFELLSRITPAKSNREFLGMSGWLIPPGPDITTILNKSGIKGGEVKDGVPSNRDKARGIFSIKIGKFLTIKDVVIVNAVPTFSKELDEDYCPVACSIAIEAQTVEVATVEMIQKILQFIPAGIPDVVSGADLDKENPKLRMGLNPNSRL